MTFTAEHFGGIVDMSAISVKDLLSLRDGEEFNEYWISSQLAGFPSLAVMVARGYAYLHYFPDSESPGYSCQGNIADLDSHACTVFRSGTVDESIEMSNGHVVGVATAAAAIAEFIDTGERPTVVEWLEL